MTLPPYLLNYMLMAKRKKKSQNNKISPRIIRRLSTYLRALNLLEKTGVAITSSADLGEMEGIHPAQVRKDLSVFGSFGIRGQGYRVDYLKVRISKALGLNRTWHIALIGAGEFSRVLLNSEAFEKRRLEIIKIFDGTPEFIGKKIKSIFISDIHNLETELAEMENIDMAIVAVPPPEVQSIVDRLGKIGIRGVLYFASRPINVPENMIVLNQDISVDLGILTYQLKKG